MPLKRALSPATGRSRSSEKKQKKTPTVQNNGNHVIITVERHHLSSLHTLNEVQKLQDELLAWFETVRHVRGMPWRKPFCENYEEQSQRAYEVRYFTMII